MRFLDKTFFKFLFGFACILVAGLFFLAHAHATGLVDINTASLEELETLNGIGASKAQAVIDYRTQNGPFQAIEDIMNVSGIKQATFDGIKDYITVSSDASNPAAESTSTVASASSPSSSPDPALKAYAGSDKSASVGEPIEFSASVDPDNATSYWSFGDGASAYGANAVHAYDYAGEYVAVLRSSLGSRSILSKLNVSVVPSQLYITYAGPDRIEIYNASRVDANLFGKSAYSQGKRFDFPTNTIIKAGQRVSFSSKVTGLMGSTASFGQEDHPDESKVVQIAELKEKILALERQEMAINRPAEPVVVAEPQAEASTSENLATVEAARPSWLSSIKRFFGFK